jgi:hypothetical protein
MKYISVIVIFLLSGCQPGAAPTFSDRVIQAKTVENTPAGARFIQTLLKTHGGEINGFFRTCYAQSDTEQSPFSLVADIMPDGRFANVAVRPESAVTRCYANKIGTLQTEIARPGDYATQAFPIVIHVNAIQTQ